MLKKIFLFIILSFCFSVQIVFCQSGEFNSYSSDNIFLIGIIGWIIILFIVLGIKKIIDTLYTFENIPGLGPTLVPKKEIFIRGKKINVATDNRYSRINKPATDYGPNWSYISQDIRARDGFKCRHCGANQNLHVHHIVPRSKGGKNHPDNLITLCFDCHSKVHPHMKNLNQHSNYQNDYNNQSEINENISNQSINIPSYRSQSIVPKNSIFCNQCGGVATLIDRQADYEKLIKIFQCEECGRTYRKKYLRKL